MIILSAQNLTKTHGIKSLFDGISFGIEEGERIGLIGANGTGKSTLLKVIAGAETPDAGQVTKRQGLRIEYASQNPAFDPDHTILDHVFSSQQELSHVAGEYESVAMALEHAPHDAQLLRRMEDLSGRMDALQAWEFESRARAVLSKLGVTDLSARLGELSGGYRKRIALARALLMDCDLLILDEPTNHLDADTTSWLEGYLERLPTAVLLVTHDRYFLDRVTQRIIELESGKLFSYEGSFAYYMERKAEQQSSEVRTDERRRSILRKELEWLSRGARARRTKEKHRVERVKVMQSEVRGRKQDGLRFEGGSRRLGGKVVELENVSVAYGDRPIITKFTYTFAAGEHLGIVGPNGAGKTTLINLITGKLDPDSGRLERGTTVAFGHFDQESVELDPTMRALDYVKREGGDLLKSADGSTLSAERMMERFLFTSQMLYQQIGKLSGGERRRLHLVRVLMSDPNFLILDEPTNDLDIPTLQALEDYLDDFAGCLVVVSHDRYFLDRVVDRLAAVEPGGTVTMYPGGYSLYEDAKAERAAEETLSAKGQGTAGTGKTSQAPAPPVERKKLGFKETRELSQLEEGIPQWEQRLKDLEIEMAEAATDYKRLQELTAEQKDLHKKLESGIIRWEELASRA